MWSDWAWKAWGQSCPVPVCIALAAQSSHKLMLASHSMDVTCRYQPQKCCGSVRSSGFPLLAFSSASYVGEGSSERGWGSSALAVALAGANASTDKTAQTKQWNHWNPKSNWLLFVPWGISVPVPNLLEIARLRNVMVFFSLRFPGTFAVFFRKKLFWHFSALKALLEGGGEKEQILACE